MRILYIFLLFCLLACSGSKKAVVEKKGVRFVENKSLTEVIEIAKAENKPIFMDVYTDWCAPCKLMDKDVFSEEAMARLINENFIPFKVDAEKGNGPNISVLYQLAVYPTLYFLDHNGRVMVRKDGAAYHTELTALCKEALMRFEGS